MASTRPASTRRILRARRLTRAERAAASRSRGVAAILAAMAFAVLLGAAIWLHGSLVESLAR